MTPMLGRFVRFLRRARPAWSGVLELAGFGLLTVAAWRVTPTLGLATGGAILVFIAFALGERAGR